MRILLLALLAFLPKIVLACSTATAVITYSIGNFDIIELSSKTITLNVNSAAPGNQPTTAINNETTYSITTNGEARKIYGSYSPVLSGPTLAAELTPPNGAVSLGNVILTDRPVPLVSGIANVTAQNLPITYSLTTTVATAPSVHQVTVLYTVAP